MKLYPLKFYPIFKDRIWGGTKLKTYLNKSIPSQTTGESWEISTVEDNVSVVSNGIFKEKTLDTLIDEMPILILGEKVYQKFGKQFPLLFKYLDAREDLSIQVHPNDELAQKHHNTFGKTEMWYVMQAEDKSQLIVGFKEKSSSDEYLKNVKNNTLLDILDTKEVKKGDVFFLATGTVHAIGAGTVIAEIQQSSDVTYRIYDFDRVDAQGNKRELHIDLALEAINYDKVDSKQEYQKIDNTSNVVVDCPFFTTNFIPLNGTLAYNSNKESFIVFMCVDGAFELILDQERYPYKKGDTLLIPAAMDNFVLKGSASLLEIYIS